MKRIVTGVAVLLIATGVFAQPMREATTNLVPQAYNVVTYSAPKALKVSELGLAQAGLIQGYVFPMSDEVRIFASKDRTNESPKARLWLNADQGGKLWYYTGGEGSAEDLEIQPGEMVVIFTRALRVEVTWTNPLQ